MFSSTLSLTWALDGVGGERNASANFPPDNDTVPILLEAGWASGPAWKDRYNFALLEFETWTAWI